MKSSLWKHLATTLSLISCTPCYSSSVPTRRSLMRWIDDNNDPSTATTLSSLAQERQKALDTTATVTPSSNSSNDDKSINSNSKSNSSSNTAVKIGLSIQGTVQAQFVCSTCMKELQQQQDDIMANLTVTFPCVELVTATQKLMNALFVVITPALSSSSSSSSNTINRNRLAQMLEFIRHIPGVQNVAPQETYHYTAADTTAAAAAAKYGNVAQYMGTSKARADFCVRGRNVTIAVLDSGIDYTHKQLGGPGTQDAYLAAYGNNGIDSLEHTVLLNSSSKENSLFPNHVVVDGYDFLGEDFQHTRQSTEEDAKADRDPIDAVPGHGTAVGDAILKVAPNAKLMALKVCSTIGHTCPDFAIAQALEYALDPNGDGNMEDKVDIINLSLGLPYFSPYYDFISKMLEETFHLGVIPIVAMGNHHNIPFVGGFSSISPSIISVGSTVHPDEFNYNKTLGPNMAEYSSRGPGFNGMVKPDLVAPAGLNLAAAGSGTGNYRKITGTSFSAPLVAGALALLKEKCGTVCSPFALKAILMNNAYNHVRYYNSSQAGEGAPVSWMGAGELQIYEALNASFWAYSLEDVQPSVGLGALNVASSTVIKRTLRVTNLSSGNHTLSFSAVFQNAVKGDSSPLTIEFQQNQTLVGKSHDCNATSFIDVEVTFKIDAKKVPPNHMTSTGPNRDNASLSLDVNEFGGHLLISSTESASTISLPFLAILRQASDVSIKNSKLNYNGKPRDVFIGLVNNGAGVAQIDAYQVISFGKDEKEANFGDAVDKVDMRMVGYRVVKPSSEMEGCSSLLEWAFQTWEPQARLQTTVFEIQVDVDDDHEVDYSIMNAAVGSVHSGSAGDIIIRSVKTGEAKCAGFHADHNTYSGTTVIRVCSDDIGIKEAGSLVAQSRIITVRYTGEAETSATSPYATLLTFPEAELSAPSYDVGPGQSLESIPVSGKYSDSNGYPPLGLMLLTDAYRTPNSTGAAAAGTETILILSDFVEGNFDVHKEKTSGGLEIPGATNFEGPSCNWTGTVCMEKQSRELGISSLDETNVANSQSLPTLGIKMFQLVPEVEERPSCSIKEQPRAFVNSIKNPVTSSPKSSLRPSQTPTSHLER